jgi:hypothetical protein
MARIPWVLTDPITDDTYSWEINPNDGGSLAYSKQVNYTLTTAPDGKVLMYEGRDEAKSTTVSGVILSEAQYYEMIEWFNKRYQLQLEDDLGRIMMIYITSFEPKRIRSPRRPWRHDYSLTFTIVDWVE